MEEKTEFITNIALQLSRTGSTMMASELADLLNQNGFVTSYHSPYEGLRGTYTLIKAVYNRLVAEGRQGDAGFVAEAFTKPDGTYAYEERES